MRQLALFTTIVAGVLFLPFSASAGAVTTTWTLEAISVVDPASITGLSIGNTFNVVYTTDDEDLAGSTLTGVYDITSHLYEFPAGTLVADIGLGRLRVSNGTGGSGFDDEYIVSGSVGGLLAGVQTSVDTQADGMDGILVWLLDSTATALQSDDVPLDLELSGFDSVYAPELFVFNSTNSAIVVTRLVSVRSALESPPVPTMNTLAALILASLLLVMGCVQLMRSRDISESRWSANHHT